MSRGSRTGLSLAMITAVLTHPGLWITAARQLVLLAPDRWWTRFPFLPVPDKSYMRFRMVTAYGGDGRRAAEPEDLLTYLRWCRAWPNVTSH